MLEERLGRLVAAALGAGALLVAASTLPARATTPEITLQAGGSSASVEGSPDAELGWGLVRVSWGDRLLLRAELAWLAFEGEGGVGPPGIGPVVPNRRGQGPGEGGQGPSGNGQSPGPGTSTGGATLGGLAEEASAEPLVDDDGSGLGDLRLAASYRLAGGGARLYRIDLGASVKLPTADEEEGLGTGETDWRLGLSGEYRFWSLTLFGGLGYNRFGEPPGVVYDDVADGFVGIESVPLADRILLSGWVEGHPEIVDGQGAYSAVGIGLRTLGSVRFEAQARAGLGDAEGDWGVSLALSFGLRPPLAGPSGARR